MTVSLTTTNPRISSPSGPYLAGALHAKTSVLFWILSTLPEIPSNPHSPHYDLSKEIAAILNFSLSAALYLKPSMNLQGRSDRPDLRF